MNTDEMNDQIGCWVERIQVACGKGDVQELRAIVKEIQDVAMRAGMKSVVTAVAVQIGAFLEEEEEHETPPA